jgi:hypothetical protein
MAFMVAGGSIRSMGQLSRIVIVKWYEGKEQSKATQSRDVDKKEMHVARNPWRSD